MTVIDEKGILAAGLWGETIMNVVLSFVVGLLVGVYLVASYPDPVIGGLQKVHVPLLGHHAAAMTTMH